MPRQRFDIGSKWLLHNQGKGALLLGGFTDVQRIEAMPGEIVQNRKYPDGLLRVYLGGERKPHHVLLEVATSAASASRITFSSKSPPTPRSEPCGRRWTT